MERTQHTPSRREMLRAYCSPILLAIAMLGFASGLPLALTAATLSAWLADAQVNMQTIGLFASVASPYAFKFLWAPLLDGLHLPWLTARLGRRRSWMLLLQAILALLLLALSQQNPAEHPWHVAMLAFAIAVASASQDIVIDAYRTERLSPEQLGPGIAMSTLGYRVAMLVSGAGSLALAQWYGWPVAYGSMAVLMAACIGITLLLREDHGAAPATARPTLLQWLQSYVASPLRDLMRMKGWWAVLLFVVSYKLGDAALGVMTNPFLIQLGFSKIDIAQVVKLYGFAATIIGSFAAGWCVLRFGVVHMLWAMGLLHALTNLMFVVQAHVGADAHILAMGITLENFTGGISNAVFVVFISRLCNQQFTATQFALLSALAALGRTVLASGTGFVQVAVGWEWFFVGCVLLALPSLVLLGWMQRRGWLAQFQR